MILVTGANGMLGQHLCSLLKLNNVDFIATSRTLPVHPDLSPNWVKFDFEKDFTIEELDRTFGKVQAIFHLAAYVPSVENQRNENNIFDINVKSVLQLAQWAQNNDIHFLYTSSACVYKDPYKNQQDENSSLGLSPLGGFYGVSKLCADQILTHFLRNNAQISILRPSSIYGIGLSSEKLIPRYLNLAKQDKTITLREPLNDSFNLIHAYDVVTALYQMYRDKILGIYNIAYSREYTIEEIATYCIELTGKGKMEYEASPSVNETTDEFKKKTFSLSINKAKDSFQFCPEIDLRTGLSLMLNDRLSKIL